MKALLTLCREIAGLFFDDGRLAVTVVMVLAATAALRFAFPLHAPLAAAFLVGAVTVALLENVIRTARDARTRG
jgi:hypothetical protein